MMMMMMMMMNNGLKVTEILRLCREIRCKYTCKLQCTHSVSLSL